MTTSGTFRFLLLPFFPTYNILYYLQIRSAAGPWYTYDDSPGDIELKNFSIQRDLKENGTLTFIHRAQEHGYAGVFQSYMDYPPDWMLKGDLPDHATVDPKYYAVMAQYFADFIMAYKKENVTIGYFSMFNEPWDSYTHISDPEMARLLGEFVGPLFDKLGLRKDTKLTYGGQCARETAYQHIPNIMANAAAAKYMDHLAYHGYDCQFNCTKDRQNYDKIATLHNKWPDLELFMTEICYAYNGDDPNCEHESTMQNCTDWPRNHSLAPALPRFAFEDGRIWGSRIISDVQAGVSGWIYWNLLLDMEGGPYQNSPKHNDKGTNLQQAVIHVDAAAQTYHPTGLFWYLAHFSKYVRNGMLRAKSVVKVLAGSDEISARNYESLSKAPEGTAGVEAASFLDKANGRVVVQLLNHFDWNETVQLTFGKHTANMILPGVSITTASFDVVSDLSMEEKKN